MVTRQPRRASALGEFIWAFLVRTSLRLPGAGPVKRVQGQANYQVGDQSMKKSIDFAFDDHPDGDEDKARVAWAVAVLDDCDGCADIRVELTVEDAGASGTGVVGHLAPGTVRRLRAALAAALREVGEEPGT
jgi:hypothetical protein